MPSSKPSAEYKPPPSDLPIHAFTSATAFEAFLEAQHSTCPGFYVKFPKKASGIASVSREDAVVVGLCFGWIDGWGRRLYDELDARGETIWAVTRYTPRRARSMWSAKNVASVERLLAEGRMRPAGLRCVEEAKKDGRWARAYAGPKDMVVPDDFQEALDREEEGKGERTADAKRFFEGLNRSQRYAVLWKVHTAPSDKARSNRIKALIEGLREGKVPGQKPNASSAAPASAPETGKAAGKARGKRAVDQGDDGTDDTKDEEEKDAVEQRPVKASKKRGATGKITSAKTNTDTSKRQKNEKPAQDQVTASRRPGLRSRKS